MGICKEFYIINFNRINRRRGEFFIFVRRVIFRNNYKVEMRMWGMENFVDCFFKRLLFIFVYIFMWVFFSVVFVEVRRRDQIF